MGHDAGDEVLKETAKRLQDCVRECDTVSRNGGDEFVIMLPDLKNSNGIDVVVNKILTKLGKPFVMGDKKSSIITGSVGVSVYPDDATDIESLFKTSDTAMYKAKAEGRNNCYYYNQELGDSVYKHTVLANELRHAIDGKQLELYYQPRLIVTSTCYQEWRHLFAGSIPNLAWCHPTNLSL